MKTINIYFDFEFTSLSTDAQPISLGIVSETVHKNDFREIDFGCTWEELQKLPKPSFYAEFSDFDLNRCDDWVKENVVSKLQFKYDIFRHGTPELKRIKDTTHKIKISLKNWLERFSNYNIQFVCDCGTFDWYWMLQLLAEWDEKDNCFEYDPMKHPGVIEIPKGFDPLKSKVKIGIPKLPSNISPVPQDLNDLIAQKKGISVREAFELNREELVGSWDSLEELGHTGKVYNVDQFPKHNSLFDAKVIKAIYEKIK